MHASIACLLLYEDYVWVSLGNAMKAKQSKAKTPLLNHGVGRTQPTFESALLPVRVRTLALPVPVAVFGDSDSESDESQTGRHLHVGQLPPSESRDGQTLAQPVVDMERT
jgi:hypothetical protein